MEEKYIDIPWTKEFGDFVKSYIYAKKVYLDNTNHGTEMIQNAINNSLNLKQLEKMLKENTALQVTDSINMSIRKIKYSTQKDKIVIINCIIIFLSNNQNNLEKFVKQFEKKKSNQ